VELMELPKITDVEIKELQTYETEALSVMEEAKKIAAGIHDVGSRNAADQWVAMKLAWCDRVEKGWLGQQANRIFKMHREWTGKISALVLPVRGDKKKGIVGAVDIVIRASLASKQAEDWRIAEENAKLLEAAKKKHEEETIAAAIKAEEKGHKPIADAILANVGNFVAPVVQAPKSDHFTYKKVWRVALDPLKKGELLAMIAQRPELHAFVIFDEEKIKRHVATLDGNLVPAWPGLTFGQEEVMVRKPGSGF
jgi:hypothetical protein